LPLVFPADIFPLTLAGHHLSADRPDPVEVCAGAYDTPGQPVIALGGAPLQPVLEDRRLVVGGLYPGLRDGRQAGQALKLTAAEVMATPALPLMSTLLPAVISWLEPAWCV
jgi:hypothetical protein